jgi:hypothetical protein
MRRKHQKFGLSLKDYESLDDARAAAQLGNFAAYGVTFERLKLLYAKLRQIEYFWEGIPYPVRWNEDPLPEIWAEKEELENQLSGEMRAALFREDAAYFKAIGELVDLLDEEARSPVEEILIHLLKFRSPEGQQRLLEWAGADPTRLEEAKASNESEAEFLKSWPASIREIHEYVKFHYPKIDMETTRKAVTRFGFPYRDETYPGSKKLRE